MAKLTIKNNSVKETKTVKSRKMTIRVHESDKRLQEESNPSDFAPMFFVADLKGNQVTKYDYDDIESAIDAARELSEENPDTPYSIGFACNTPVVFKGKLSDFSDFLQAHPEFVED